MRRVSPTKLATLRRRVEEVEKALRIKKNRKFGVFCVFLEDGEYWIEHPDPENVWRKVKEVISWEEVQRRSREKNQEIWIIEYTDDADE